MNYLCMDTMHFNLSTFSAQCLPCLQGTCAKMCQEPGGPPLSRSNSIQFHSASNAQPKQSTTQNQSTVDPSCQIWCPPAGICHLSVPPCQSHPVSPGISNSNGTCNTSPFFVGAWKEADEIGCIKYGSSEIGSRARISLSGEKAARFDAAAAWGRLSWSLVAFWNLTGLLDKWSLKFVRQIHHANLS